MQIHGVCAGPHEFFLYFLSYSDAKGCNTALDVQEICQGELCRTALEVPRPGLVNE